METKTQKPITVKQIKAVYTLMHEYGIPADEKEKFILYITNGRTKSVKELNSQDLNKIFDYFAKFRQHIKEERLPLLKAIYKIAWVMGIIYGNTDDDFKMNLAKLDMFCRKRGAVKKDLYEQNLLELKKTHRQFEAMLKKFNEKKQLEQELKYLGL